MSHRARLALYRFGAAVIEAVPERLSLVVARRVALLAGRRGSTRYENVRRNVAHALAAPAGSPPLPDELLASFVRRGLGSYAQYWVEGAKLTGLSLDEINGRFTICEGLEHLVAARALGRGVVIALPHVGSWEWGGAHLDSLDLAMTAVAEALEPPELFEWFSAKRAAVGISIVPLTNQVGATLSALLREGAVVGLLCDRDLSGTGVEVTFFGERVTMPAGPATLALRTGATLVAAACYSGPGRDHFAVITPPIATERLGRLREDVVRVTQAVTQEIEGLIRRAPEQWHVLEDRFARG